MTQGCIFYWSKIIKWVALLLAILLLLASVLKLSNRFVHENIMMPVGDYIFSNPGAGVTYIELRNMPASPDCNPNTDVESAVTHLLQQKPSKDVISDWDEGSPLSREQLTIAVSESIMICKKKIAHYQDLQARETKGLRLFRWVDGGG